MTRVYRLCGEYRAHDPHVLNSVGPVICSGFSQSLLDSPGILAGLGVDSVPTFVIKATDPIAVQAIDAYLQICRERGLFVRAQKAANMALEIAEWQMENNTRIELQ